MAVLREFFCPGHGPFESFEAVCPHGCSITPEREFRTAPAYHNGTTRRTDDLVRSQVEAMGLSNIRTSLREGDTARMLNPNTQKHLEAIKSRYPSPWGAVPKAGRLNVGEGIVGEIAGGGGIAAFAGAKTQAAAAVESQTGMKMNQDFSEPVRGSKFRYEAVRDPDNLRVDKSKAA